MSQQSLARMEQLASRVKSLADRSNNLQVQLGAARQQYADAAREAIELADCKSSNLDDLRKEVADKEAANAQMERDLERAVGEYEAYIARIEKALADPESMTALLLELEGNKIAVPAAGAAASPTQVMASEVEDI